MPWCDPCSRLVPASTGGETQASCPSCGAAVVDDTVTALEPKAPWHFKLLVASASGYLLWRAVQAIAWLVARL